VRLVGPTGGGAGSRSSQKQAESEGGFLPIGLVTELTRICEERLAMNDQAAEAIPLSELEARQDDVLRRLEELDGRVTRALAEWISEKAASKS
jgi:hypothetical protein